MRAFACGNCGQLVFFDNTACLRCGTPLGFVPERGDLVMVVADDGFRRCSNATVLGCNWMVAADDRSGLCASCHLTRTRPTDAESDDAHRERTRTRLGEAYRTMLGHFRHEIGHYYWPLLVGSDEAELGAARAVFGDERVDYGRAMKRHYDHGAPPAWEASYVSAYATMHPWEDWAETFAHYLHIRDTLQTAASFGMLVTGPVTNPPAKLDVSLVAAPSADLDEESFDLIVGEWLPLTYALNAVNRSMGKDDLYPFVLTAPTIGKLAFVHERVRRRSMAHPPGR